MIIHSSLSISNQSSSSSSSYSPLPFVKLRNFSNHSLRFRWSISVIRCEALGSSSSEVAVQSSSSSSGGSRVVESQEGSSKAGPYPGGMGPYTGRDPSVKKPGWLRQRAPQGEKFQEVKDSLSRLNLNTVCEEAQCPNIGEVSLFFSLSSLLELNRAYYS